MPVADISAAFPYYNESKTLRTTLRLISQQTLMPREVFFVNSSSTDGSSQIIDEWIAENQPKFKTKFHNIFEGTDTPSSSKNVAIKLATSNWIAFMDCGLTFDNDWLRKQWDYVQAHPEVDLVSGGCILVGAGILDMSAVAQTYGYKNFRPTLPSTLVKKSVFKKTGLFLADRRAGYDFAWPLLLKHLGIKRGINTDVVIRYIGVNYGNSLTRIFKKSIVYAAPTVGIPHYYIPYYYLLILAALLGACAWRPSNLLFFFIAYVFFRGYYYPIKKSNGFALIRERKLALLTLPVLGIILDTGRVLGIIKGVCLLAGSKLAGKDSSAHTKAALEGLAWIGFLYGLAKVTMLAAQMIAGRWLGPLEYGRANLAVAAAAYLQILPMLGFPTALGKLLADEKDEARRARFISTALLGFAAWFALALPAMAVAHRMLENLLGMPARLFTLSALLASATAFYTVVASPLLGLKRFAHRGLAEIIYGLSAPLLMCAFFFWRGPTHASLILALSAALALGAIYALWSLRRYLTFAFEPTAFLGVLRYASVATLNLLAIACVLAPARLFLNRHASAQEVGLFSAYFTATVQIALAFLYMLQSVLVPMASGDEAQRDIWSLFRRAGAGLPALLAAWLFFGATAVAGIALFGRSYNFDLGWAAAFAGAAALILMHGAISTLYAARDFSGLRLSVAGNLVAGFGNVALTAFLVPSLGVLGAALALIISFTGGITLYGLFAVWERRDA